MNGAMPPMLKTQRCKMLNKISTSPRSHCGLFQGISSKVQVLFILAAPAEDKCPSLVWPCYVSSRDSSRGEGVEKMGSSSLLMQMEMEVSLRDTVTNGIQVESTAPLKSNLKKSSLMEEMINSRGGRKVSWSDDHGEDIAHVQEFEPSEEGELRDDGNFCRCAIQ